VQSKAGCKGWSFLFPLYCGTAYYIVTLSNSIPRYKL
jgi:hypothetical protein